MDTGMYFEMVISILIGLTFITLCLIFLYMVHGRGRQPVESGTRLLRVFKLLELLWSHLP